jgi:hypothetical protein
LRRLYPIALLDLALSAVDASVEAVLFQQRRVGAMLDDSAVL